MPTGRSAGSNSTAPSVLSRVFRSPCAARGWASPGFHWSVLRRYTAEGALRGFLVQLLDSFERSVMSVEYSPAGDLIETSKATFAPTGDVHYVLHV